MLRKILTTTALVTALSVPALAADNANDTSKMTEQPAASHKVKENDPSLYMFETHTLEEAAARGYLASNLIGKYVYASNDEDAETVGDINDLIIGEDGTIQAVILGAGGFLGVGEKDVALDFDRLAMHETGDDEFRITSDVTKAELEGAAEYERPDYIPQWMTMSAINDGIEDVKDSAKKAYDSAAQSTQEAYDSAKASLDEAGDNVKETADQVAEEAPEVNMSADMTDKDQADVEANWMEDKVAVDSTSLTPDELVGATVYDVAYNSVGEVDDVVTTDDGKIKAAVVDAGGFLGLGEKPVAIKFSDVRVYREQGGDDLYIKTALTEDELSDAKEYDKTAYATQLKTKDTVKQ